MPVCVDGGGMRVRSVFGAALVLAGCAKKEAAPSTFLDIEERFRRILGYWDAWTLKAILDEEHVDKEKGAA